MVLGKESVGPPARCSPSLLTRHSRATAVALGCSWFLNLKKCSGAPKPLSRPFSSQPVDGWEEKGRERGGWDARSVARKPNKPRHKAGGLSRHTFFFPSDSS